jgi:hypothetical protein
MRDALQRQKKRGPACAALDEERDRRVPSDATALLSDVKRGN